MEGSKGRVKRSSEGRDGGERYEMRKDRRRKEELRI
jgi:hypothetical protein